MADLDRIEGGCGAASLRRCGVKIADRVLLQVEGEARSAPEGKAAVVPASSEARPVCFLLSSKATLRKLSMEGVFMGAS